ncbi:hypothetical protein QRX25_18225 [Bacillus sp. L381]|uniref:hypothetical protein n=1 Tax=Bacillus TaxID=1386 RepID=UPI001BAA605F|nr:MULTISPECIES: hypothetical protein [Bacillus]MCR9039874.1 hypothetical protein [Bacillus velezensis]QUN09387.1 hypothetical protein KEF49_18015 [Bacillus amyloliquefaciens]QYM82461.1 hypothetical protein KTJ85_17865 [Bacillus sp. 7D3]QZY11689.1 hypothetical protein K7B13_18585 [Bacillus amyloliquefaciens]WIX21510.1 hypothetical protein QRX25_18225 [Bacillus sp. L381]
MQIAEEHFNIKKTKEWLLVFWKNLQLQPEEMEAEELMHLFCGLAACHHFEKNKDTEEVILYLDRYFGEKTHECHPVLFAYAYHVYRRMYASKSIFFHNGREQMVSGLKDELKSDSSSMILMVLAAYFKAVTSEELIVFLENGLEREADLLMASGGRQEELADALYVVTYLQMKELQPFLIEWYKTSDFAFSGLMLAECRRYHIDAVAKYTAIMKFLQFDEALFIREGREFLCFQQRSNGGFGYLNPLAMDQGKVSGKMLDRQYFLPSAHYAAATLSML